MEKLLLHILKPLVLIIPLLIIHLIDDEMNDRKKFDKNDSNVSFFILRNDSSFHLEILDKRNRFHEQFNLPHNLKWEKEIILHITKLSSYSTCFMVRQTYTTTLN